MDSGHGIDPDGQIFRFPALTGYFKDVLGVSQKAAHKNLIGAANAN
jgi:hypothetical protein